MRDFSLPLTVRSAHYVAGRGRVITRKVMYHVTKTCIILARLEQAFTLAKKTLKNRRSFKKSHSGGGFFDLGCLQCLGVVA